jgi:hypothetical protein
VAPTTALSATTTPALDARGTACKVNLPKF